MMGSVAGFTETNLNGYESTESVEHGVTE